MATENDTLLKSILDGITHIRDRVEKVIDIAQEHTGQLSALEERTKNHGEAMVALANKVEAQSKSLSEDVDAVDKKIDAVQRETAAELKKKVDSGSINKIDNRLRWVERIVFGLLGMGTLIGIILEALDALKK